MEIEELQTMSFNELYKDFGINSYHREPFSDEWDTDLDLEETKLELQRTRLSIEIENYRYYFKTAENYKAFKTKFNLL